MDQTFQQATLPPHIALSTNHPPINTRYPYRPQWRRLVESNPIRHRGPKRTFVTAKNRCPKLPPEPGASNDMPVTIRIGTYRKSPRMFGMLKNNTDSTLDGPPEVVAGETSALPHLGQSLAPMVNVELQRGHLFITKTRFLSSVEQDQSSQLALTLSHNVRVQGRCAASSRSVPWNEVLDLGRHLLQPPGTPLF